MTNIDRELEDVIKEELIGDIDLYAEAKELPAPEPSKPPKLPPPVKTYKKLAGLKNLGKTFFINGSEIKNKDDWVQTQMTNLYGAELFGRNAQLAQKGNDGQGRELQGRSSLITCQFQQMMELPKDGFVKESYREDMSFKDAIEGFLGFIQEQVKDEGSKITQSNYNDISNIVNGFNYVADASEKKNEQSWGQLVKKLKSEPWKSLNTKGTPFAKRWQQVKNAYNNWENGGVADSNSGFFGTSKKDNGTGWNRFMTYRIDIITNFTEEWYKQKFKSGMLNKMIALAKSEFASHAGTSGAQNANKEYKSDEMTGRDNSKLDSIRWKMTNKVAKDYIRLLLGWTRKKEIYWDADTDQFQPVQPLKDMVRNDGYGKKMARKALDDRGLWGRLKQKLLSGQQASNTISVAFQAADYGDGWDVVQKPDEGVGESTTESEFIFPEDADPFEESDFIDSERIELVESACQGNEDAVDELIYDCLK